MELNGGSNICTRKEQRRLFSSTGEMAQTLLGGTSLLSTYSLSWWEHQGLSYVMNQLHLKCTTPNLVSLLSSQGGNKQTHHSLVGSTKGEHGNLLPWACTVLLLLLAPGLTLRHNTFSGIHLAFIHVKKYGGMNNSLDKYWPTVNEIQWINGSHIVFLDGLSWDVFDKVSALSLQVWSIVTHKGDWLIIDLLSLSSNFLFACSMMMVLGFCTYLSFVSWHSIKMHQWKAVEEHWREKGVFSSWFLCALLARLPQKMLFFHCLALCVSSVLSSRSAQIPPV